MNDAPAIPVVTEERESKPAPVKKVVARKPVKKAQPKTAKAPAKRIKKAAAKRRPAAKKSARRKAKARRAFPYLKVLKMWKAGKTLENIARSCGRYQKGAADPLHGFRVALTRFHRGVKLNGRLVKLPHRISRKALKLATKAGRKSVS